jgi:hypothetical protein
MTELHERFAEGLFEARWQPSEQAEFHNGENRQNHRAEEQKSEANKINQIRIQLFNIPVLALAMPESKLAEKPDSKNSDTGSSLLDIVEIILKMIADGAKAIFPKRKEKN